MQKMFIVLASALFVGSGLYSMEQKPETTAAVNAPAIEIVAPAPQPAPTEAKMATHQSEDYAKVFEDLFVWDPVTQAVHRRENPLRYRIFIRTSDGKWFQVEKDLYEEANGKTIADSIVKEKGQAIESSLVETLNAIMVNPLKQSRALYSKVFEEVAAKAHAIEIGACRLARAAGQHVSDHLGVYSRAGLAGLVIVLELAGAQLSPIGYATATLIPGAIAVGPEIARLITRGTSQLAQVVGQNAIRKAYALLVGSAPYEREMETFSSSKKC